MSLATITRSGPEISDAIVSFDPNTLQRRAVKKADVLDQFRQLRNHEAVRIVQQIPERDGVLDPAAVDKILITSHCEMQRMSEEFQHGKRVAELLKPILNALRHGGVQNPIRIVDIGCGTGFVIRWLAASGSLGDDVELMGVDFNVALLNEAQRLAAIENLRYKFAVANAFDSRSPQQFSSQQEFFITSAMRVSVTCCNNIAVRKHAPSFISIFIAHRWRRSGRGSFTSCACASLSHDTTAYSRRCAHTRAGICWTSREVRRRSLSPRSTAHVYGACRFRESFTRSSAFARNIVTLS